MKKNILIMMILMLFLNPLYSEEISKTIPKIPQTQEVEKNISQESIEEGIFYTIGKFLGTKIIIPIIMFFWDIIVVMFSYLWVFLAPIFSWLLPILGGVAVLLLVMGSA